MKPEVTVVDYGMGNIQSIQRAVEYLGASCIVSSSPDIIKNAERIVLPGVGAFQSAINNLIALDQASALKSYVQNGGILIGICLGMQLLFEESEEFGISKGLGILPGRIVPIPRVSTESEVLKVPHIGWNTIYANNDSVGLDEQCNKRLEDGSEVYFVHSFMAQLSDDSICEAYCNYGGHKIPAIVRMGKIIGCQFHPEKSGVTGLDILKYFISL